MMRRLVIAKCIQANDQTYTAMINRKSHPLQVERLLVGIVELLVAADYMDYAYKLASAGDSFVSTTISTNDAGRQAQHFFIVNAV